MRFHLTGCLFVFLAVCLASGCDKKPPVKRGARVERLPRLEVVQPVRKRLERRLEMAATVEALNKVDISARVPGIVKDLDPKTDIGREVKRGELLCRLDVPELEAERQLKETLRVQAEKQETVALKALTVAEKEVEEGKAEDRKFKADIEFAKTRYTVARDLVRQNAQQATVMQEALKQYESAQAALGANEARTLKREARVEAARADIDLARQKSVSARAELKKVEELVSLATVRAPFDGVITRRSVDPGAIIKDPGTVLFTFMAMDRVRVLIDVPQRDVPLLNAREQNPNPDGKGDIVTIRLPSLTEVYRNGEVQGYVTRVSRSLDPVTRTMRAEVEVENKGLHLRPGMFGSASLVVENRSNVLTLPASALVRRGEGLVEVYQVADPKGEGDERRGVLKRVPVVLGIDDGKEVEIREGLSGDELIVLRATSVMRADEAVLAVTERESLNGQ